MTTRLDNPAGRLYSVLRKARSANVNGEAPVEQGWAATLGSSVGSTDLLRKLVSLNQLLDEATEKVARLERSTPEYEAQLKHLRTGISPTLLRTKWHQTVLNHINDGAMMALGAYSEILSMLDPDGEIPDNTLSELLKKVEILTDEFVTAGVNTEFARFAVNQLNKIRAAILEYRFRGPQALAEAQESITGAFVGFEETVEEAKQSQKPAYESLGTIISLFNAAIQAAEKFSPYAARLMESVYIKAITAGM